MRFFRRFRADVSASIPVIASMLMLLIVGVTGAAVDFSMAAQQKARLQGMIDSAATALAMDPEAPRLGAAEIDARALAYALAAGSGEAPDGLQLLAQYSSGQVTIEARARVAMFIGRIFGFDFASIAATVTVERAQTSALEIALVLDNTGSMEDEKIRELRRAAKLFLDRMEQLARQPGDIRIAMVPFGRNVRADPDWMQEKWLSGTRPKKWKGCLTDRAMPHDIADDPPDGQAARLFVAVDDKECGKLAPILPLTEDFRKLRSHVDEMIADGSTNIPIGLVWGLHALSPRAPLEQSRRAERPNLRQVLIVLTDGDNTDNRWNMKSEAIDARLRLACRNARDAGIVVFTIRLIEGNERLLRDCATSDEHYFNIRRAKDLPELFSGIAGSLTGLRITR
ncbi:VWA domain-containing protein [Rhabdaerophilum sp. SD176]|uniref:VWA domain-containing protein n=1 Tax=Rhabdaerophilum sp. SD176 TaxID=2983548 RepID=UPI0024DF30DF|nr:VWA domain-containing protein [Rhabdaerophilum sp. SD176]